MAIVVVALAAAVETSHVRDQWKILTQLLRGTLPREANVVFLSEYSSGEIYYQSSDNIGQERRIFKNS